MNKISCVCINYFMKRGRDMSWRNENNEVCVLIFLWERILRLVCTKSEISRKQKFLENQLQQLIAQLEDLLSIYTLLVCFLFVCLYPINGKTAETSGQNFVCDLTWPKGMENLNFQKLASNKFRFSLNLKKSMNFFF